MVHEPSEIPVAYVIFPHHILGIDLEARNASTSRPWVASLLTIVLWYNVHFPRYLNSAHLSGGYATLTNTAAAGTPIWLGQHNPQYVGLGREEITHIAERQFPKRPHPPCLRHTQDGPHPSNQERRHCGPPRRQLLVIVPLFCPAEHSTEAEFLLEVDRNPHDDPVAHERQERRDHGKYPVASGDGACRVDRNSENSPYCSRNLGE